MLRGVSHDDGWSWSDRERVRGGKREGRRDGESGIRRTLRETNTERKTKRNGCSLTRSCTLKIKEHRQQKEP